MLLLSLTAAASTSEISEFSDESNELEDSYLNELFLT